jgi:hypothetical protein
MSPRRFGTVRPRVQIPGPRPKFNTILGSALRIAACAKSGGLVRIATGLAVPIGAE